MDEQRVSDLEDVIIAFFALQATNDPSCLEGGPATKEEIEATQTMLGETLERIQKRVTAR